MRKSKDNFGAAYADTIEPPSPDLAAARTGVTSIETVLYQILLAELSSLSKDAGKRTAYLAHLFDEILGKEMREMISKNLALNCPRVFYGYARQGAEMPCVSVILEDEQESQGVLGQYVGETLPDERGSTASYTGSFWDHTYTLLIYAEHPQITAGLYQVVKAILVGAENVIEEAGFSGMHLSGGELAPNQEYIPENIFARALRVQGRTTFSVPEYGRDPARFRVTVHADDVIVDGVRGGVHTFTPDEEG